MYNFRLTFYIPRRPPIFDCTNYILLRAQIAQLIVVQFSPFCAYCISLSKFISNFGITVWAALWREDTNMHLVFTTYTSRSTL